MTTSRALYAVPIVALLAAPVWAQSTQPSAAQAAPAQPAPAQPDFPLIRIGALSYLQYDVELENREGFNYFDVTRMYLNINAQVSNRVRFRFTPDIRRISDGSLAGSLVARVKYAFAQFDTTPGAWVRVGAHQTPWLDFEESINRYRVQGTMFAEREGLIPGSSDFGASYLSPLPNGYGEMHGGVFNGEGFGQPEANKYKSAQARLTVRPFPNGGTARGLRLSGFFNAGWYAAHRPRQLGILMGSFEHRNLVATLQTLRATEEPTATSGEIDRSGWSVFVEPRQGPSGFAALLRYDSFDPNRGGGNNAQDRVIAGGAYWFVWPRARVGVVLTNEQVHYDLPSRPKENRLLIQTHVEF